jgi:crotonobetainyl-CoA:carnitine CoA-transferase CaiB-like acyl-CoA transferase
MNALEGIKIVSFNHFLMGPAAMQTLGDLGADVIAVEPVGGAFQRQWGGGNRKVDGESLLFLCANRNKRSMALDLKSERGVEIAHKLVMGADVVAENFRPGVMDRLGLGYEDVKAENPGVIYASASGYGSGGPYVNRPGQDMLIQAMSGLAAVSGDFEDGAHPVGVSAVDHHGAMIMAMSILAALINRNRTGEGCRVDVNLLSSAIDLQMESLTCFLNGPRPETIRHPKHSGGWMFPAPYGAYNTKDGQLVLSFADMPTLAKALDEPKIAEFKNEETFPRREEIIPVVQGALLKRTTKEWEDILTEYKLWHAPVNDYAAVESDPQVAHLGSFEKIQASGETPLTVVKHPVQYNGKVPPVRLPPQPLGAQTAEVMQELGYSEAEIQQLAADNIVGLAPGGE